MPLVTLNMVALQPDSPVPLQRQLYAALREAIVTGRLPAGGRLPSTRVLTQDLAVSRNTVLGAFDQLIAEGYLVGRPGSGTYVTDRLPDEHLQARHQREPGGLAVSGERRPSQRAKQLAATLVHNPFCHGDPRPFRPCVPDVGGFPVALWEQLRARALREAGPRLMAYGDPLGYWPLREAVAAYLRDARGARCEAAQVVIVSGSQLALDLAATVLLDPGERAWMEEPGYVGAKAALVHAGATIVPVPLDAEGLTLPTHEPPPRVIYTTPSRQFPLGMTMSLCRRMALLDYARRCGAWILEDDYDSEYRYVGRPLACLQGLDTAGQVVYAGTMSKIAFPSLRLGYLVVPPALVDVVGVARATVDGQGAMIDQATLQLFIAEGHLGRHIRRMRKLYAERLAVFQEEARRTLGGLLVVNPTDAGLSIVGWLPPGTDDVAIAQRAAELGVAAAPLSMYAMGQLERPGLLLGFAPFRPEQIRNAMGLLARALSESSKAVAAAP